MYLKSNVKSWLTFTYKFTFPNQDNVFLGEMISMQLIINKLLVFDKLDYIILTKELTYTK